jgi:hypothetical protein
MPASQWEGYIALAQAAVYLAPRNSEIVKTMGQRRGCRRPKEDAMFKLRGSVLGLQSSGYQLILAKHARYEHLVALYHVTDPLAEPTLAAIKDALENRIWKLVPYPKYDYAFARLFELRNLFCRQLPLGELLGSLLPDISDDLNYPGVTAEQRNAINPVEERLRELILANAQDDPLVRSQLEELSQLAAQAREAHWLKINMGRNRLAIMGLLGLALLLVLNRLAGSSLEWLVTMYGILGGLVSAVMTTESIEARISEYYLNRRLIYLRPIVGGIIALVVYKALKSKVISIVGISDSSPDNAFLVIAFIAGFAERAFVSKLLAIANIGGGSASRPTPAPTPTMHPAPIPGTAPRAPTTAPAPSLAPSPTPTSAPVTRPTS